MGRRPRALRCAGVLGGVLIIVVAVAGFLLVRYLRDASRDITEAASRLPAELAAARSEGLPLDADDLRRRPPLGPTENGAPHVVRMAKLVAGLTTADRDGAVRSHQAMRRKGRSDADRKAARELLATRKAFMLEVEAACRFAHCDLGKPYERGPNVTFEELPALREGARLLSVRSILASDEGWLDDAFADIERGMRLGRFAGEEPVLIALLVREAVEAIMGRAFTQIVLDHIGDPKAARLARAALASSGPPADLAYACRGEVVMGRVAVQMVRSGSDAQSLTGAPMPPNIRRSLGTPALRNQMCDAWESRIVSYWRSVFAAFRAHSDDPAAQGRVFRDLERVPEASRNRPSYILLSVLAPVLSKVGPKLVHVDAERRLRETLVSIIEHRSRHGTLPERLAQLPSNPPRDPFADRPLTYRRSGDGFVLYSVGENGKDDGGVSKPPKPGDPAPDIVIQYPQSDPP